MLEGPIGCDHCLMITHLSEHSGPVCAKAATAGGPDEFRGVFCVVLWRMCVPSTVECCGAMMMMWIGACVCSLPTWKPVATSVKHGHGWCLGHSGSEMYETWPVREAPLDGEWWRPGVPDDVYDITILARDPRQTKALRLNGRMENRKEV